MKFGDVLRRVSWAPTMGSVWTLCHGKDWKKLLDLRFTLWDQCFAVSAIIALCPSASYFQALIQGLCACSPWPRWLWCQQILHPFSTEKAGLASREGKLTHCIHVYYRREIIHALSYHLLPSASLIQNKGVRAALSDPLLSQHLECCLKQDYALSIKRKW